MSTKLKGKKVAAPPELPLDLPPTLCVTIGDRLTRIQALAHKVEEHIRTVAAIESCPGTSAEAREKAVALFLERLTFLERALGQTLEELHLG